jgi:hypothetical protein
MRGKVTRIPTHTGDYFFPALGFFAVLAESLKSFAVGAPAAPGFRIFSPDPAAIRARLALMFAYNPGLAIVLPFPQQA